MKLKKYAFCAGAVLLFFGAVISTQFADARRPVVIRSMPPGEDFCIANLADFNRLKSQLPPFLQNPPILLGADTNVNLFWNVVAALKLSFRGDTLILSSDLWDPTPGANARYTDLQPVRRVCFYKSTKKLVMEFGNGVFSQSGFTNSKLISAEGIDLLPVTPAQHEARINKIRGKNGGRAGRPKPAGVTQ